jgi:hypothetical protein
MEEIVARLIEYGLLVVFANVFLEQLGVPIPALPTLVVAGALTARGRIDLLALPRSGRSTPYTSLRRRWTVAAVGPVGPASIVWYVGPGEERCRRRRYFRRTSARFGKAPVALYHNAKAPETG